MRPTRRRWVRSVLVIGSVLLAVFAPLAATPASAATAKPLDLAAMVLQPDDLPGGYGIWGAHALDVDHVAALLAGTNAAGPDATAARLRDAGWRYGYLLMLGLPDSGRASGLQSLVEPQVMEFATRAGAAKAFDVVVNRQPVAGVSRYEPETAIGDQAVITIDRRNAERSDEPMVLAAITFRRGNLIAPLFVATYGPNARPTSDDELVRLARVFERRIDAVVKGAPGLSTRALHLAGDGVATAFDNYERIGGKVLAYAGETGKATAARDAIWDARKVTDAYAVIQTSGDTSVAGFGIYALYLQRFARQADAEAYMRGLTKESVDLPGTITRVAQVKDAPTFGDESKTFSYTYERSDKTTAAGYVVYLRTGRTEAAVRLDALPGVSLATVRTIAGAQAICQKAGDCRTPLASPLKPDSGPATPTATPAPDMATPRAGASGANAMIRMVRPAADDATPVIIRGGMARAIGGRDASGWSAARSPDEPAPRYHPRSRP